jgi:glucose/arabinose dehydrogenase
MPPTTPTEATSRQGSLASIQLRVQPVLGGLDRPVGIAHAGDGSGRLFVVEKGGRIRVVHDDRLESTLFLDISARVGSKGNEQGLLGLAFHPNFQNNGFFYVNYTDLQGNTVIARFSRSADPARADPNSELVLLRLIQPASNHNGGHLAFGPDGYLYIGTGDGGGAGDQYGHGQNTSSLLGKMLRIDVDGGAPYAIPASNPFVNDPAVRDEIWALGLRNPWRYAFDRQSGDLFIADVGQNRYEEVNVQPADSRGAENYGWPIMEGQHCFPDSRVCDPSGLVLPAVEYDHNLGCSVTGGVVYRGRSSPALAGIYLFGDYCSGTIWGMARAPGGPWTYAVLAQTDLAVTAFGEDESGEIYLVDIRRGELLTISAAPK